MFRSMAIMVGIMLLLPVAHANLPITARTFEITQIYHGLHRSEISIVYPILGLPAILEPGDELRLGVVLREQVQGGWRVEISLYGERIQLPVRGITTWNGIEVLSTTIPENAPLGIYDVYVWKGESWDVEGHALSVWEEKDHITLVHITDTHMDAGSFSDRTAQRVVHSIDVINLVRPDLVVITGDITTGPPATEEDARNFADLIVHNLQAPIFYTPGNHDARLNVMDWRLGWPANSFVGYYAFMNPYPDYAFDLGPVHFVSLDHKWEVIGSGLRSSFTPEQLDYLGDELSSSDSNVSTIMFHDHWRGFDLNGYDYDLILAGHNHNNLAYRMPGGSLLLVTGAPDRTDDMIRVVEFSQEGILSCSYHPYDLASATPTKLVDIDVCPAEGGGCYQRLEVKNNLVTGLYSSSWIFNLTINGPGWGSLVIGGELDSVFETVNRSYYHVNFDLPPSSWRTVECYNQIPTTWQTAIYLDSMICGNIGFAEYLTGILGDAGTEWKMLGEVISSDFEEAIQYLNTAKEALDGGNWTGGGVMYSRAINLVTPIQKIVDCLRDAEAKLQSHREVGLDTSLLDNWVLEALQILDEHGLYPSLMGMRREDPTPESYLTRIANLGENEWQLADRIVRAEQNVAQAIGKGQDLDSVISELNQVKQWFDLGYYSLSTHSLEQIRVRYPEFFVSEFHAIILVFLILLPVLYGICEPEQSGR